MADRSASLALVGRRATNRRLTLATLCAAVLIAQVDTSVVNLAVRPIGEHFDAGVGTLQWVVDSYNLAYAVLLLTGGLLADLYGRRLIFMAGAATFSSASLLCALAPTAAWLVTGRTLAGIGAALLLPSSLAIIRVVWTDPAERARALGLWTACNGLAFVIGPTLGGLLIQHCGWRSIFLVVVPLGLAALGLAPRTVPESAHPEARHFDAPAQLLGIVALGGLAVTGIESHRSAPAAAIAVAVAVAALALFLRVEARRGTAALVPLDIFRNPPFRAAVTATAGMTFGMYGLLFLFPLVWQRTGQLTPVQAGLALIPMAVVYVVASPFSGALAERFGTRPMNAGGVAVIGCGLAVVAASAGWNSLPVAEIGLVLTGLGMGLATGSLTSTAVGTVTAARSGTAAALINVARMTGATIGVSLLGAVYAISGGGPAGLRVAMAIGAAAQLIAAGWAWRSTRRRCGPLSAAGSG